MDTDRVDRVTRLLWILVAFEAGFLLLASPYHLDGWIRALIGGGAR